MRRKESAIISSSLQSLQLWSGKQHPGHAVRHRDFALLLQRVREQEGLTEEGNEATYLLWYCRFLYLQAAGGLHQSVHQIITSTHLHTCSNCVCVCMSLLNDSLHPFMFHTLAFLFVWGLLFLLMVVVLGVKKMEMKLFTFWAKRHMKYIHKAIFDIAPGLGLDICYCNLSLKLFM